MNNSSLLYMSIVVFSLMLIGLVLTMIEFKYGAPKKQAEASGKKANAHQGTSQRDSSFDANEHVKSREHEVV